MKKTAESESLPLRYHLAFRITVNVCADGTGHSTAVLVVRHMVTAPLYIRFSVAHGDGQTGRVKHGTIIVGVSAGHHLFLRNVQPCTDSAQSAAFIDVPWR